MVPNMQCGLFSLHHFVHKYMHNSKKVVQVYSTFRTTVYYRNYLLSELEMYARYEWQLIQTCIATTFQYDVLCILTLITIKNTGRIWILCILNNCSTIRYDIFQR